MLCNAHGELHTRRTDNTFFSNIKRDNWEDVQCDGGGS